MTLRLTYTIANKIFIAVNLIFIGMNAMHGALVLRCLISSIIAGPGG